MKPTDSDPRSKADEFERQSKGASAGVVREFIDFLLENKKWWLLPIVVSLAIVGVFILLSSTAAAPFIYTLF